MNNFKNAMREKVNIQMQIAKSSPPGKGKEIMSKFRDALKLKINKEVEQKVINTKQQEKKNEMMDNLKKVF